MPPLPDLCKNQGDVFGVGEELTLLRYSLYLLFPFHSLKTHLRDLSMLLH